MSLPTENLVSSHRKCKKMNPCFAIIDKNTLSSTTLKRMLCNIYDQVEVCAYGTIDEYIHDSNRHFVQFFVSTDILFEHADEFETLKSQTMVISIGRNSHLENAGFNVLDVTLPENEIVGKLTQLDMAWHNSSSLGRGLTIADKLSTREKEVLKLMVKGLINKEISATLGISTPTVIFHRNNICEKLKTRSIGKLTVFAVLTGLIELNEI